jgi:hypothetical protein
LPTVERLPNNEEGLPIFESLLTIEEGQQQQASANDNEVIIIDVKGPTMSRKDAILKRMAELQEELKRQMICYLCWCKVCQTTFVFRYS